MIGQTLRSRYKITKELPSDALSNVYLTEDTLKSKSAQRIVRRFQPDTMQKELGRLFRQAVGEVFQLANYYSQIPDIIDYFEDNRYLYLVEEAIDGHPLSEELIPGQPWSEADVMTFLAEILELVALIHRQNLIHQNIAPQNIWRRSDGKLMLTNFGNIARVSTLVFDRYWQATSTQPVGVLGYMPSEQYIGTAKCSSDLYAVGTIAISALTGIPGYQLPKDPNTLELVWRDRAQVSEAGAKFLNKLVCYHYQQRYCTGDDALEALNMTVPQSTAIVPPLPVKIDGKYGYQDRTGKVSIQPEFDMAYQFSDGLAAVRVGQKWGYINPSVEFVIPLKFNGALTFSEGLARIQMGQKYGYIDRDGTVAIEPKFAKASNFHDGLAAVAINEQWNYIDRSGNVVIEPPGDRHVLLGWVSNFSEGLARIKMGNLYGFMDKSGQVTIAPEFDEAGNFCQGLARVKLGYQWGYIDPTGKMAIEPQFDRADDFCARLAAVKIVNKWGFIDRLGQQIIPPNYDRVGKFSEKLCAAKQGKKWGYIDTYERFVIPPQYHWALPFYNGLALVNLSGNRGYIDKMGNFIKR